MNLCVILFFTKQKRSEEMFPYDYQYSSDGLFFKHELTVSPPCDAFSMHTHNYCELLYFLSGDATHVIEDRKFKLRPGDLILIRPYHYHFIQVDSPKTYNRFNILFDEDDIGFDMKRISEALNVINISDHPRLADIFSKLDFYAESFDSKEFLKLFRGILVEILYNLSLIEPPEDVSSVNPLISDAIEYINEHLFTIKDVNEISDAVFVTDSYLFKLFKRELHKGPKKYLTEKRLLAAQKQISLGKKPSTVFSECGFSDYTSFYRSYVKYFGHPPSDKGK